MADSNMTTQQQTVAVTGATGFVGRYVVRALLARGHKVRALIRSREKAREVLPLGNDQLTLIAGDVLERERIDELLRGCTAAVHLVGIIREKRDVATGESVTFRKSHVEATRSMVAACQAMGVQRYIHMSALGVTSNGVSEYQKTKFEAETIVRLSTLSWTVLRPGLIHGRDGEFVQMMAKILRGEAAPFLFAPYFTRGVEDTRVPLGGVTQVDPVVQPISVEDVAAAFAAAVTNDVSIGEVYNLVGSEKLDWPTLLRAMRDAMGAGKIEPFGLPAEPAAIGATVAGFIGLGNILPFDAGMARMAAQDSTANGTKFREDFRMDVSPFKATFAKYAGAL